MFRYFANGVYLVHGALLLLASASMLLNYRAAIQDSMVNVEEFEAITSASNAGSYCAVTRVEHCFVFFIGILLLSVGTYVPVESKGVPSIGTAVASFVVYHSEIMITTNTLSIQVYQGEFTEFLAPVAYLNLGFGVLYGMVALGSLMGLAKTKKD